MQITKLDQMFEVLKSRPKKRLVVAWAVDEHTICAVHQAVDMGLIDAILVGDEARIKAVCQQEGIDPAIYKIVHATSDIEAAAKAVALINAGEGDFIMKGLLSSDRYLKAILNKETGCINPGAILSHVTVAEVLNYHKLLIFGDVAIIPLPDLNQKIALTNYLIKTAQLLGIETPKVGIQAASEQTLPKIASCADGALITKMAQRGQIKGAIVEGPLGFDMIVDRESALIKGVDSPVCGDADCILFPNIEAGNTFYKTIGRLMKTELCAIVMGARVPAILTSRGDSEKSKLYSIALGAMLA
jgi:phosphotransacetylase